MLTIRLRRMGAKKNAHFRVVVADRAAGRDGPFLEILGHYHPRSQPAEVVFNMERTDAWLDKGAQMSDTVRSLYRRVRAGRVESAPAAKPAPPVPPALAAEDELVAAAEVEAAEAPPVEESSEAGAAADAADAPAGDDASGDEE